MKLRPLLSLLMLACAAGVSAQTMKPGLWEITNQMKGSAEMNAAMADMQKQMAEMDPEERKMVQAMMAKQGVQIGATAGGGIGVKVCMTQEMIDRNQVAPAQQGDCTHSASPRNGKSMKFNFKCTTPPSSGQGELTFISPEAYISKLQITAGAGGTDRMDINSSAKWLSSNCGSVKPIQVPAK